MFIKVSVPGQFRLKMMPSFRSFLMHRDGEVHYIGGTDILPAPFDSVREAEVLRKFGTSEDKEAAFGADRTQPAPGGLHSKKV